MTDAHLTPHGRVLVALANELAKLAAQFSEYTTEAEEYERDGWLEINIEKTVSDDMAARLSEAARIAGSLSTELLSVQTGRE